VFDKRGFEELSRRFRIDKASDRNDRRTTVYDKRGVEELSWWFKIEKPQVRKILTYFFAANRDRANLENRLPTSQRTSRGQTLRTGSRSPCEDRSTDRSPRFTPDSSTLQMGVDAPWIDLPVAFEEKSDESSNYDDGWTPSDINLTPYERETGTRGSRQTVRTGSPSVNIIIGPFASPSLLRGKSIDSLE